MCLIEQRFAVCVFRLNAFHADGTFQQQERVVTIYVLTQVIWV